MSRHLIRATVLLVLFFTAGCTAVSRLAYLPTGQPVMRITCPLSVDGMTTCFMAAGHLCGGRGYVIYDWSGRPWARPYPTPETLQDDTSLASQGLLVACGA